ncbi:hypothetical protein RUND412_003420, partial [Rhizina undulata]
MYAAHTLAKLINGSDSEDNGSSKDEGEIYIQIASEVLRHRYLNPRIPIPKTNSNIELL